MIVFICGFSGCGKTTLYEDAAGCLPSQDLNFDILDLDSHIKLTYASPQQELGEFIEEVGMEKFRQLEYEEICKLLKISANKPIYCFLGGGSLEGFSESQLESQIIKDHLLVWLKTDFDICWNRIKNDANRPMVKQGKERMLEIYLEREKKFSKAQIKIETKEDDSPLSFMDVRLKVDSYTSLMTSS